MRAFTFLVPYVGMLNKGMMSRSEFLSNREMILNSLKIAYVNYGHWFDIKDLEFGGKIVWSGWSGTVFSDKLLKALLVRWDRSRLYFGTDRSNVICSGQIGRATRTTNFAPVRGITSLDTGSVEQALQLGEFMPQPQGLSTLWKPSISIGPLGRSILAAFLNARPPGDWSGYKFPLKCVNLGGKSFTGQSPDCEYGKARAAVWAKWVFCNAHSLTSTTISDLYLFKAQLLFALLLSLTLMPKLLRLTCRLHLAFGVAPKSGLRLAPMLRILDLVETGAWVLGTQQLRAFPRRHSLESICYSQKILPSNMSFCLHPPSHTSSLTVRRC